MPWPCTWCGQFNAGFSQQRDPATASAAELVAEIARYGLTAADGPPADGAAQRDPSEDTGTVDVEPAEAQNQTLPDLIPIAALVSAAPPPQQAVPGPRRRQQAPRRQSARRRRDRPQRGRRYVVAVAAAAGVSACLLAIVAVSGPPRMPGTAMAAQGNTTRPVRVAAGPADAVVLQGVPGQLSIFGTSAGQVTLTGQLHWAGRTPVVTTRLVRSAGVLLLTVQCAPGSTCTEDLVLSVPAGTAATVRQPAGRVVVTGLAAPLAITAANVDITATGLTSPALTAVITSGHLSATFAAPPREVAITLASAQATLRLPASVAYRVSQQVVSGYVSLGIPQDSAATRTVTARLDSAELQLLPS